MTQQTVNEWYANKLGKTIPEFDDYDFFVAKVAFEFWSEFNEKQHV